MTTSSLYKLQNQVFLERQESEARMAFNECCCQMEEKSPTFQFWFIVLKMELVLFTFLQSIRAGNFQLYLYSLEKIDHLCTGPFSLCKMAVCEITNPDVYQTFNEFGCFVVSRTKKPFLSMGLNQRHEQHNKDMKGYGGF